MLLLPPGVAPSSVTRLSLDVGDAPGVLLRVLGICQRRGARVAAMTYSHPRIELAVEADERHLRLLLGRLEGAIDVLKVAYDARMAAPSLAAPSASSAGVAVANETRNVSRLGAPA